MLLFLKTMLLATKKGPLRGLFYYFYFDIAAGFAKLII